jgi:hypothetical protein
MLNAWCKSVGDLDDQKGRITRATAKGDSLPPASGTLKKGAHYKELYQTGAHIDRRHLIEREEEHIKPWLEGRRGCVRRLRGRKN